MRWGPRSEVQPDILVLPRLASHAARCIEGLATLVVAVEVLSPSSARADRVRNREAYLRDGVAEYWVVDCDARVVERWRSGHDRPDVLDASLTWLPRGGDAPLVVDLGRYFRQVHAEP